MDLEAQGCMRSYYYYTWYQYLHTFQCLNGHSISHNSALLLNNITLIDDTKLTYSVQ